MSRGGEAERPGGTAGVRRAARYHRVGSYVVGITAMKAIPAFLFTPSQTGRLSPPISTAASWTVTQHSWGEYERNEMLKKAVRPATQASATDGPVLGLRPWCRSHDKLNPHHPTCPTTPSDTEITPDQTTHTRCYLSRLQQLAAATWNSRRRGPQSLPILLSPSHEPQPRPPPPLILKEEN